MSASATPLRLRPFRRLAAAYLVNGAGDWIGDIAIASAVYSATRSPVAVTAVWLAQRAVPGLLTFPLVARLEVVPTGRLLPALYAAEALAFALLTVAAATGALSLALVLPLALLDGLAAPVARAFARAAVADVTRPEGLLREGNAILNILFTGTAALGPALGGLLVVTAGISAAFAINAASFLMAAALLGMRAALPPPSAGDDEPFVARARAGVRYVAGQAVLRDLLRTQAGAVVFLSAILPLEIVLITDELGGDTAAFGLVLTAWGIGMVAGGIVAERAKRVPLGVLLLGGALAEAASYVGMGVAGAVSVAVVWSAVGGLGNGAEAMAFVTAIQERTADAFQARVNGLYEAIMTVGLGLGVALGGSIASLAGPRAVYVMAGTGALTIVLWGAARLYAADWQDSVVEPAAASG